MIDDELKLHFDAKDVDGAMLDVGASDPVVIVERVIGVRIVASEMCRVAHIAVIAVSSRSSSDKIHSCDCRNYRYCRLNLERKRCSRCLGWNCYWMCDSDRREIEIHGNRNHCRPHSDEESRRLTRH